MKRLLYDALRGDATLFTRWDEVRNSWIFIDMIQDMWGKKELSFPNYAAGTWGPEASHELLKKRTAANGGAEKNNRCSL